MAALAEPLAAIAPIAGRPGAWTAAAGTGFALIDGDKVMVMPAGAAGVRARPVVLAHGL